MLINTAKTQQKPRLSNLSTSSPTNATTLNSSEPEDSWVGAALSVAGGVATIAGQITGESSLSIGGVVAFGAGTALTARSIDKNRAAGHDGFGTAALVSVAGGGALVAAGLLMGLVPEPVPQPQGPLPQLMQRLGLKL